MKLLKKLFIKVWVFPFNTLFMMKIGYAKVFNLNGEKLSAIQIGPGGVWYKDSVYKIRRSHDYIIFIIEMVIVSKRVLYSYHPRNDVKSIT